MGTAYARSSAPLVCASSGMPLTTTESWATAAASASASADPTSSLQDVFMGRLLVRNKNRRTPPVRAEPVEALVAPARLTSDHPELVEGQAQGRNRKPVQAELVEALRQAQGERGLGNVV